MTHELRGPDQDQSDEDIFNFDVPDEALENAADVGGSLPTASMAVVPPSCC
jgi:hypothetical protein